MTSAVPSSIKSRLGFLSCPQDVGNPPHALKLVDSGEDIYCKTCSAVVFAVQTPMPPDDSEKAPSAPAELEIRAVCTEIAEMLVAKNRAYGNSALDPVRIFSKASPVEQILVRLDDKLSRLARGEAAGEDVIADLCGYLILLRVAQRQAARAGTGR